MKTKQELSEDVVQCVKKLAIAEQALVDFMQLPENNRYDDLQAAKDTLYGILEERASEDCEGSYNCGNEQYTQLFMVGDKTYEAVMELEYNRHDKTYYYIDEITKFEVKEVTL